MKENTIWIELLYLLAGIIVGVAVGLYLPDLGPLDCVVCPA